MDTRPIQTEAEYKAAMQVISALIELDPERGTPDGDRLAKLGALVQTYEGEHYPIAPSDSIETVRSHMASKWNGQACPICGEGTLHDGEKAVSQKYKGRVFNSKYRGSFCDKCSDGFVEFDAAEEAAWLAFRDQVDGGWL